MRLDCRRLRPHRGYAATNTARGRGDRTTVWPPTRLSQFCAYSNSAGHFIAARQDEGVWPDQTPIYNLSFGAVRPFLICDLKSSGQKDRRKLTIVHEYNMHPGDMIVLPHTVNRDYTHCVPRDTGVTGLRISLGFRRLTKHWIREVPSGFEYFTEGDETERQSKRRRRGLAMRP